MLLRQKELNRQAMTAPPAEARELREQAALIGDAIFQAIADGTADDTITTEQAYGMMAE